MTRQYSNILRGMAILCIALHNYLHAFLPFAENERNFDASRTWNFLAEGLAQGWDSILNAFCFLGWYGVPVFIFLSGYGLVKKYEQSGLNNINFGRYFWNNFKKLFILIFIPLLIFVALTPGPANWLRVGGEALFVLNIIDPRLISPGVYWYFGLALQLYVIYWLVIHNKKSYWMWELTAICFLFLVGIQAFGERRMMTYSQNNFVAWMLPFVFGIWISRKNFDTQESKLWIHLLVNFLLSIACLIIVISFNVNPYAWLTSSIFALLGFIAFSNFVSKIPYLRDVFNWVGNISAALFVIHPIIRKIMLKQEVMDFLPNNIWLTTAIYLTASILLAWGYQYYFNKVSRITWPQIKAVFSRKKN